MKKFVSFLLFLLIVPSMCLGYTLTISWDQNSESDLAGYKLFVGNASGNYPNVIKLGTVNTYTINDAIPGAIYYITIKAFDNIGNESSPSTEVNASVPIDGIALLNPLNNEIVTSRPTFRWSGSGFTKYTLYTSINNKPYQKAYSGRSMYYKMSLATWTFYTRKGTIIKWYVVGINSNGLSISSPTYLFTRK